VQEPCANFVDSHYSEVWWRSLFRSTSLDKWCTSYNAPPTSRKRAPDRLPQAAEGQWNRSFWARSSLFMVVKVHKSHGARFELYGGCSKGVPPISASTTIATFQLRDADARLRLLRHPKNGYFKTTVTPFSRSGWNVLRSASLAKEGTSKKRPSPHLHKVPTRSDTVSPWTLQTVLLYKDEELLNA
jgi:hypothetical protein